MKTNQFKFCFWVFFLLRVFGLSAQEAIISVGNNASSLGGSVSFSVGQVFFNTDTYENASVQQGVQQTYEIKVFTEREVSKGIQLECVVYPNPTSDFLVLKMIDFKVEELEYKLYNNAGMLLDSDVVDKNEMCINMRIYFPATYFLKIIQHNQEIKVFKIIKK